MCLKTSAVYALNYIILRKMAGVHYQHQASQCQAVSSVAPERTSFIPLEASTTCLLGSLGHFSVTQRDLLATSSERKQECRSAVLPARSCLPTKEGLGPNAATDHAERKP